MAPAAEFVGGVHEHAFDHQRVSIHAAVASHVDQKCGTAGDQWGGKAGPTTFRPRVIQSGKFQQRTGGDDVGLAAPIACGTAAAVCARCDYNRR